jgi:hypothetical protein
LNASVIGFNRNRNDMGHPRWLLDKIADDGRRF